MREPEFWIKFVLASLATWRVTHLLAREDGPADVIVRLRARLGSSLAGALMDCFKCLSLWIAAPAALFVTRNPLDWLLTWLALSGAVCLLERLGQEPVEIQPLSETRSETMSESKSEPIEGDSRHVLRSEKVSFAEPLHTSGLVESNQAADHSVSEPARES